MTLTKDDRIKTVYGGGGHVVILGAGASIATTLRNQEANGKKLPSMDNFVQLIGLTEIVDSLPESLKAKNFEELYSKLYKHNPNSSEILEIESRVYDYFKDMQLPDEATLYDYLVLSLRPRDLIATFNWDPFLFQAFCRNGKVADMPRFSFLHGNVAIGYNTEAKKCGPADYYLKPNNEGYLEPTRLLYPVDKKNYNDDEFINMEWGRVKYWLESDSTKRVTIFGYGAPKTDIEAITLMNQAYGTADKRNMEQFEIIDIKPEDEVVKTWEGFIHSHHYDYCNDYFKSSLAYNPRRTFESYHQHNMPMSIAESFSESNPVPNDIKSLDELWDWHKNLFEAENEWKKQHPDAEL
ncbi:MAG: SIR2 family protein [Bacteroidia bacterium]